jgi:hypothetical protein
MPRKKKVEERNDRPATLEARSVPPVEIATSDQLKEKILEIRERVEEASKPAGPLTTLFGVTTSSS